MQVIPIQHLTALLRLKRPVITSGFWRVIGMLFNPGGSQGRGKPFRIGEARGRRRAISSVPQ